MIIEEITIRNWRRYREPHTFRFDERFNLLVGRNEAGKSTLFEAFTRVLFDRHSSRAEEIRQIQPLGSSLGPEATIVFWANGTRYRVRKRFLQMPLAELSTWREDRWEPDHEGDQADNKVREILRGEKPGRSSQPEHRGLCQALWYLQSDDPLPEKIWADGVNEGLSGIVSLVAKSPEESRILKGIEDEYAVFYTPTGRVKAGSPLDQLQKTIPEIENELQTLYESGRNVEKLREELESFAEELRLKKAALKDTRAGVADLKRKCDEGTALEGEKIQKEKDLQQIQAAKKKIADDLGAIDRRRKKIDDVRGDIKEKQHEEVDLQAEANMELRAAEKHHDTWKNTHEPELRQVEKELDTLRAIEQIRRFEEQTTDIQEKLDQIDAAEEELRNLEHTLSTTPLPTKKELKTYQEKNLELATLKGQLEQAAIRIRFDLQARDAPITTDPDAEYLTEDEEYLVLGPTAFTIGGLGTIRVRGGGSSLEDLQAKEQSLSADVALLFKRFGVVREQELYDLQQRRQELDITIKRLKKTLNDLTSEKDSGQLNAEVNRIRQKITVKRAEISAISPELQDLSDDAIRERAEALDKEKKKLTRAVAHEQENEDGARAAHEEKARKAREVSNHLSGLRAEVRTLEQENDRVLRSYGTYEHLQEMLTEKTAALDRAEEDLEALLTEYRIRVEEPKAQYEDAREALKGIEEQIHSVREEIIAREARIKEAVSRDFYSRTGDLEAELETAKRKLKQAARQAKAVKLLHDMAQAFKKDQSTALSGPVADLMNRWLMTLTGGSYDSVRMNASLLPVEVSNPRYDEALPLKCLSYGTHEQVIVLLRLAIGVLLSRGERNLIVIDDRLVNADPLRMRRLCQILEEVSADHCQIVVATCNDTPYAGIRGKTVIPVLGEGGER
jgi:exonuclease SbcC